MHLHITTLLNYYAAHYSTVFLEYVPNRTFTIYKMTDEVKKRLNVGNKRCILELVVK